MEDELGAGDDADAGASGAPDLTGLARVEGELGDVERALQRLDDGTYGTCSACGAALTDAELEAAPASALCGEHR
jgi:RNA polymerase-binding transcription factor DksA